MATVHATVSFGDRTWLLHEGEELCFGRSTRAEIPMGTGTVGPADVAVSRHTGRLTMVDGRVRVRNESKVNPLYIYPRSGPGFVLNPGTDEVWPAPGAFRVVLDGEIRRYEVTVVCDEMLTSSDGTDIEDDSQTSPPTRVRVKFATPREREIVAVFCEDLLRGRGDRRPLQYGEAARRLNVSKHYLENLMLKLCNRHFDLGLPGMGTPDAKDELCRRAFAAGAVTLDDLPPDDPEGGIP